MSNWKQISTKKCWLIEIYNTFSAPFKETDLIQQNPSWLVLAVSQLVNPQYSWLQLHWKQKNTPHIQTRCYFWWTPNTAHHKHTIPTMKQCGGSVMLWGCFSAAGPARLVKVEGKMNAATYSELLEDNLIQSAREQQLRRRSVFQ